MNALKTFVLLGAMSMLLVLIGGAMGGQQGALIALGFSVVMNAGSYWFSDRIVLRAYKARIVTDSDAPQLVAIVRRLARQAGLPMPRVAVLPGMGPNAFATGRNPDNAVVAVTEGLLQMMTPDELEGVVAHELGHVKNRDILISTLAAAMVGAITMVARWGMFFGGGRDRNGGGGNIIVMLVMMVSAPLAAVLIQMAVSRSREFGADQAAGEITGKPLALASALRKLESFAQQRPTDVNPATSHMFIVNPLGGSGGVGKLFRTHPVTAERVARLEAQARGGHATGPATLSA
ncbi:MAG: zinc metalloprotease HtpX [Deltaproteobacteria bacterium]|nr:zinc metalloprotease HtpX [Deltaproteobacteria bacterium]